MMAHLFSEGFPYEKEQLSARWDLCSPSPTYQYIAASGGPYDDRYVFLQATGYSFYVLRKNITPVQTVCVQFHYKTNGLYNPVQWNENQVLRLHGPASVNSHLVLQDDGGFLAIYRGHTGARMYLSTTPLSANVWHHIQVKAKIDDSTGTIDVTQDSISVISATGQDTRRDDMAATVGAIHFGCLENTHGSYAWTCCLANIIVMDTSGSYMNDLLGVRQVKPCMPTANGNYAQWTPSAGQNWECVNEIPPNGDTDYTSISTAGSKDTFVVPDVDANAVVDAVVIDLYAKTADPGAVTMKGLARSNSQDGEGSVVTVPSSYAYLQSVIYRDPNGNIAWNGASFNAAEFGYKKET